jgi:hypothetical protein
MTSLSCWGGGDFSSGWGPDEKDANILDGCADAG